ncbi:unnamed protein product [Medioppia subpectinata]|uniref:CCDC66 domain-containing protein n=1 Tax=Medioppia subpectinata TaxID=1979941 RepID=A0A7R9KEF1_9ACAR|nr:unnamed protein product [Medioppia subpectinata]CAG2100804.1 unnamed protein product [Medioppia subpectinata]
MLQQKATETVTLTRNQLQAILELISQIGGISRSESRNEVKSHFKNDNKIVVNGVTDGQLASVDHYWESGKDDIMAKSEWISNKSDSDPIQTSPPLLMINDSQISNRLLSASLSDLSRPDSVMTNESSTESKYRRYARINDSEFDWNELQRKRIKALEYSKALALQYEEKKQKRLEEQQRIRDEELMLEKRLEEERVKMKTDYEIEQNLIEKKRLLAEKKREAVVEAIERTPVIKKRHFLIDRNSAPDVSAVAAVAAVKPQTRTHEMSAQTEKQNSQFCEIGTQTDVQLLLYLLNEMKLVSKERPKSKPKLSETLSTDSTSSVGSQKPRIRRKLKENTESKADQNKDKVVNKRPLWVKTPQTKANIKTNDKTSARKYKASFEKEVVQSANI